MEKSFFVIFLNGEYPDSSDDFYRRLISRVGPMATVAVDGGLWLFERLGIAPDIWLGDADSSPQAPAWLAGKTEIIRYPEKKDKSDGQLAVELAYERSAQGLGICGYRGGDSVDHVWGNLGLLEVADRLWNTSDRSSSSEICALSPGERVWFMRDQQREIPGSPGDTISVIPLDRDLKLDTNGLSYPAKGLDISRGSSRGLSNSMISDSCRVSVGGAALVFWRGDAESDTCRNL